MPQGTGTYGTKKGRPRVKKYKPKKIARQIKRTARKTARRIKRCKP